VHGRREHLTGTGGENLRLGAPQDVNRPLVYISGPLQAAADLPAARRLYERIAAICEAHGYEPYLPHQRTDPSRNRDVSAESVFRRDIGVVRAADVIVAVVGTPSSGVGAELAFAYVDNRPVIALWHRGERPSRFVEGMLREHPRASLVTWTDERDLGQRLSEQLEMLRPSLVRHVVA
jgi:nucleoside 2-deoxyribosyltransferase